eukprot:scaffold232321_cov33-Tisochrysis_lutea.AAC.2
MPLRGPGPGTGSALGVPLPLPLQLRSATSTYHFYYLLLVLIHPCAPPTVVAKTADLRTAPVFARFQFQPAICSMELKAAGNCKLLKNGVRQWSMGKNSEDSGYY